MTRPRYSAQPDANQPIIVAALQAVQVFVWDISPWCPWADLLCWGYHVVEDRMMLRLIEVKTEDGELTAKQRDFMAEHPGAVQVCRTAEDALFLFGRDAS